MTNPTLATTGPKISQALAAALAAERLPKFVGTDLGNLMSDFSREGVITTGLIQLNARRPKATPVLRAAPQDNTP